MTDPLVDGTRAGDLVAVLTARGETVATAESLTAGLLTATIAGVPGASNVLRGGLVVYATDLKATLAGVDPHPAGRGRARGGIHGTRTRGRGPRPLRRRLGRRTDRCRRPRHAGRTSGRHRVPEYFRGIRNCRPRARIDR
ncbi:competence/damage inducible protein cinA [Rhodococcus opacus PD630]|nr:competence/damage inducible protein cinA [Rhodococcus opacus PD630]